VLFLVPGVVGLVVEPLLFLLADRYPRRWFVAGGLGAMALAAEVAALAGRVAVLAAALAVWSSATGVATSIARATLVDAAPARRVQVLARWTLFANAGDLLAPAVLAGVAALGLGWRAGFAVVGGVLAASAVGVALHPDPLPAAAAVDDEDGGLAPGLFAALRVALADRVLMLWLFGTALCDLLDEILIVLASLHVRTTLGASPFAQGALVASLIAGGIVGLLLVERWLPRWSERRLLVVCSLACAAAYTAWLFAPALWLSIALAPLVGAAASPLYPLTAARAYARAPGRSGVVLAASHLFTPFGLLLPIGLGAVADRAGTHAALALLLAQPLGLAVLAVTSREKSAR
jgi:MFS family permease